MNQLEGQNYNLPTSTQIIEKVSTKLTSEEYLLLSPTNKWPVSHVEDFANSDMVKSSEHPYHQLAIYQYNNWQKGPKNKNAEFTDYYNKPLTKPMHRTKTHFTLEIKNERETFLAEILTFAIALNRYLFSCNKLMQFLASGDVSKYYQLWVNEVLINKGWLFLQSFIQLALITHDFKQLKTEVMPQQTGAKHLHAIINKRLAPLYQCDGSELMSYWKPVFLYILHPSSSDKAQHLVPANFQSQNHVISSKSYETFRKNISDLGTLIWVTKFGRCLGLLD